MSEYTGQPEGYPEHDTVDAVLAWVGEVEGDEQVARALEAREFELLKAGAKQRSTLLDDLFHIIEPGDPDPDEHAERMIEVDTLAEGSAAPVTGMMTSYDELPEEALPPEGIDVDDEGPVLLAEATEGELALLAAAAAKVEAEEREAAEMDEASRVALEAQAAAMVAANPVPFDSSPFVPFVAAHLTYVIPSWLRSHAREKGWSWEPTTGDQCLALVVAVDLEREEVGLRLFPAGTEVVPCVNGVRLIADPVDVGIDHAGCAFRAF